MPSPQREWLKGSLDLMLLALLEQAPMYGYQIVQEVRTRSSDRLQLKEGSLYPALHRLEQAGLIEGFWQERADGANRRYYRLTGRVRPCCRNAVSNGSSLLPLLKECCAMPKSEETPFDAYIQTVLAQLSPLTAEQHAVIQAELEAHLVDAAYQRGFRSDDPAFQAVVIAELGPPRHLGKAWALAYPSSQDAMHGSQMVVFWGL